MFVTLTRPVREPHALSVSEASRQLDVPRKQVQRLASDGWLHLDSESVGRLAERRIVSADEPLAVLRLGPPRVDPVDQRPIGAAPGYTDDELVEAARKWWTGPVRGVVDAGHLVLTVAGGWVIGLLAVDGIEAREGSGPGIRSALDARLVARVTDLPAGSIRMLEDHELIAALGHRIAVPHGERQPIVIIQPES